MLLVSISAQLSFANLFVQFRKFVRWLSQYSFIENDMCSKYTELFKTHVRFKIPELLFFNVNIQVLDSKLAMDNICVWSVNIPNANTYCENTVSNRDFHESLIVVFEPFLCSVPRFSFRVGRSQNPGQCHTETFFKVLNSMANQGMGWTLGFSWSSRQVVLSVYKITMFYSYGIRNICIGCVIGNLLRTHQMHSHHS